MYQGAVSAILLVYVIFCAPVINSLNIAFVFELKIVFISNYKFKFIILYLIFMSSASNN